MKNPPISVEFDDEGVILIEDRVCEGGLIQMPNRLKSRLIERRIGAQRHVVRA